MKFYKYRTNWAYCQGDWVYAKISDGKDEAVYMKVFLTDKIVNF